MIHMIERFEKVSIYSGGVMQTKARMYYICPYCGVEDCYIISVPQTCTVCNNELPRFDRLRESLIDRVLWHFEDEVDQMMIVM